MEMIPKVEDEEETLTGPGLPSASPQPWKAKVSGFLPESPDFPKFPGFSQIFRVLEL
jgi:hypothetical protein